MPCPECAAPTNPGARFCHVCGSQLDTPFDDLKVGDRRVVTALFADLVGYTQLVDELDPEEVRSRVDGALKAMAHAVVHFGGSLEKFVGDAVLAVFGVPVAHDDDALRSCLCAVEMQQALARFFVGDSRPLELRIGIATGEVVAGVREMAGSRSVALTGEPMTTAARLQQLAEPGEVLLDQPTASAAAPRIAVERVGERLLRGQSRPVAVNKLRSVRRMSGHPCERGIPLVGRDAERARLVDVLMRTAATGHGGAVVVTGEPGVGKSRLLCDIEEDARAAGFGWIWIDNAPYGMDSPYRAVRNLAEWLADEKGVNAGILSREVFLDSAPEQDPETMRLVLGSLAVLAHDSEMILVPEEGWDPAFARPADPGEIAAGFRLAARRWITYMVSEKPSCVVVDDFHWIDPSSRVLMAEMVRLAAEVPLVVLTGSRPPVLPDWVEMPHVELIELGGLDADATEQLGTAMAGGNLEAESARWLYQRTSGNALFVTEILRTLGDGGQLERVGEYLRIDRGAGRRSVPLSLRALLGARIDALPPGPRGALELASVIGMTFPEWLLCELRGLDSEAAELALLAEAGILAQSDEGVDGSGIWRFKHQLFMDAAYGRLLAPRRRHLHAALADRLEAVEPPVGAAELARHRVAAGDVERALPLLQQAAREAASIGAVEEAEAFLGAEATLQGRDSTTSYDEARDLSR
jgi:adenylate cyclase